MPTRRARSWRRLQENPLLVLSLFLAIAAVADLSEGWTTLTFTQHTMLISVAIGGGIATFGALAGNIDAEGTGLALLVAALVFLLLKDFLAAPISVSSTVSLLVQIGAFVATLAIRLYVVRRAAKARRIARKSLAGS